MTPKSKHRKLGSTYIMVLGTTLIVAVIGLSALTVVRVERRSSEGTADLAQARLNALSAIERGLHEIANDPDWRTNQSSGSTWASRTETETGSYSVSGVDPSDNNFKDRETDPVVLTGTGVKGDALYRLQVTLTADAAPLTCLEVSLHANNDLIFNSATLNSNQIISANDSVTESGSVIDSDVEAVNAINGAGFTGGTTTGITPRTMPDPTTVFDYYVANGTSITVPGQRIDKMIISPDSNPFGATTDPEGVYVIDCQGLDFTITKSRIVGTLVLLRAGANSEIKPEVNWEPAVANYPALLVDGTIRIDVGSTSLAESSAINFNPFGTPYDTVWDDDLDDTYPPVVKGLVYVSTDLVTANAATIDGVVVVGNAFNGSGNIGLTYRATFLNNPPPGFTTAAQMYISPGTWSRLVD